MGIICSVRRIMRQKNLSQPEQFLLFRVEFLFGDYALIEKVFELFDPAPTLALIPPVG
jgi:hypothetical protein